jgi:hypothetical protein
MQQKNILKTFFVVVANAKERNSKKNISTSGKRQKNSKDVSSEVLKRYEVWANRQDEETKRMKLTIEMNILS